MTEDEKMWQDAVTYGTGFMNDGKHIPIRDVYAQVTMKQKMIEAAIDAAEKYMAEWADNNKGIDADAAYYISAGKGIDAALAVMADPANWTDEMGEAAFHAVSTTFEKEFHAIINHIRGQ